MPPANALEGTTGKPHASLPLHQTLLSGKRPYLVLGLLTLLFWARTLSFQFVWDDTYFIERNEAIRSLKNAPAIFTSLEAQSSFPRGFVLYRPLRTLHYAALFTLGGGAARPALFHLANILWHAAAALLLFSCARNLLQRFAPSESTRPADMIAFLIAFAFAIHPVVTEVVCWAKSLDDIMATVFVLASLRFLLSTLSPWKAASAALASFVLALLSKESSVPFAAASFLVIWFIRRQPLKLTILQSALFFAAAALFMLARHEIIGRTSQAAPISGSYAQTLIDTLPAAVNYLRLLAGIPPFVIDYDYMPLRNTWANPRVLAGAFLVVAGLATMATLLRKPPWRTVGFGLAWFALFILPVSNLVPTMQFMAERFLYLPMVGILLAIGAALLYAQQSRALAIAAVAILACWTVIAWQRAAIWRDPVTLFLTSLIQGPPTPRIENNAIAAVLSLPHMQRVFQIHHEPGKVVGVGLRNSENANWTGIVETLNELSRVLPKHPSVNSALGIVWAMQGHPVKAVPYFQKVTEASPRDAGAWGNLGQALLDSKRPNEARHALGKALQLAPNNLSALRSLSSLHWQNQDYAAALPVFEQLAKLEPQNPQHLRWAREAREHLQTNKP